VVIVQTSIHKLSENNSYEIINPSYWQIKFDHSHLGNSLGYAQMEGSKESLGPRQCVIVGFLHVFGTSRGFLIPTPTPTDAKMF
jgi:hypothetical protein